MATPIGPQASQVTQDAHRVGVEIDISEITSRLEAEALRLINDLSQQGKSGEELADLVARGLREVSDAPIERASRGAVGEAFNLGRNVEAQRQNIGRVVRTEILDENTCDYCRDVDGTVVDMNSAEYLELMPPNGCEGREQCRGFYLYEAA